MSTSNPPSTTAGSPGAPPVPPSFYVSSTPAPTRNPFAVPQSADAAPQQSPRELWRGPGNVVIEEAPSALGQQPPTRSSQPPPPLPPSEARPFVPLPPEEVHRPMSRRVPDLEDFPPIGQREFRAKSGNQADGPSHRDQAAPPARGQPEPPARGGLLHRMIGSARRSIRQ
jgi:cell division protein FtsZ